MSRGLYEAGTSFLHRADPTAKIVMLCAWFTVALMLSRPAPLAALGLFVAAVAALTGLIGLIVRFSRFMATLFVLSAVLWALLSTAGPVADGGPEAASGVWRGALLGMRLVILLAMGLIFLGSTRVEDMAAGMQRLGVPFMAAFSLTLAFRLLPLFTAAGSTIVQAQACRGLDVREGGPLTRLRRYLPLLVPLVLSSLRAADGLAVALESKGLGMGPSRTSALTSRFGTREAAGVAVSVGAAAAAIALRVAGAAV